MTLVATQNETVRLAEFAANVEVPAASVTQRMPWLVVDNVAAALIGARQPWYRSVLDAVRAIGSLGQCAVVGAPDRVDSARAALLLGVAIGGFEAGHGTAGAQQSAAVFPAVLALAQTVDAAGPELLTALAIGYEVNARVAAAQTNKAEASRGFHNPAISGVFGAAAGCARLLGLDSSATSAALGIAGSSACGLIEFVWDGALTKRVHLGRAAQLGLEAALFAQHGLTGPATVLEGEFGFLRAYSPTPEPDRLVAGLGTDWSIEEIFLKPYPTHGTSQPIVAALDAWHRQGGDPRDVTSIQLLVSSDAAEPRHTDRAPTTVLGAQYSVPFTAAVAVLLGADGVRGLDASTLRRADVRTTAAALQLEHDPQFRNKALRHGAEVRLMTGGGQTTVLNGPGLGRVSVADLRTSALRNLETYAAGTTLDASTEAIAAAAEAMASNGAARSFAELLGHRLGREEGVK